MDTKERIINAATELFLENGYEKTKMEDIAKKASLTKMMLYYYFRSKQDILKNILKNIFDQAIKKFELMIDKNSNISSSAIELFSKIHEFIGEKKEFLRFIFSEVIKGGIGNFPVLSYLKEFYDKILNILSSKASKLKDRNEIYIKLIFFQSIPLICFYILKDELKSELKMEEKRLEKTFVEKFMSNLKETLKVFGGIYA